MPSRIEDYALIGDGETAALVDRTGSIDWLCWPRFDSDACFAALLGTPEHGRWRLAPRDPSVRVTRRYRDSTLILETRFETASGAVVLTDFMPLRDGSSEVVRMVTGVSGRVAMAMELVLRFGTGAIVPWVSHLEDGTLRAIAGPDMVVLQTPVRLEGRDLTTVAEFTVRAGETVPFVLAFAPSHHPPPPPVDAAAVLAETEAFWRDWASSCRSAGRWSAMVVRSLVTLKALIYAPTGGIVAAPTTSLPECLGGTRNWDYRFCWVRDSTLTLFALMNAGYFHEAQAWRDWLVRAVAGSPEQIQIMYGLAGERRLTEWEVSWLPGYEGSRPVRIGNDAYRQLQLDVFGEVMATFHQARHGGLAPTTSGWDLQQRLLAHLDTVWREPDEGIWEVRGPRQHFTFSKAMCWLAYDRALRSAEEHGLPGPVAEWRSKRDAIHADICANGVDPARGCFVQAYGSRELDASLLLLPIIGFLPVDDPRIAATVAAIEHDLLSHGFVLRYRSETTADGLPPGEGVFLACSFWLVDVYVLQGRRDEARALFERLLSLANDVGLFAEEYDVHTRRQVGNFPQAFTHVALVNSAYNLVGTRTPAPAEPPEAATAES
ncbi:glucoamylase [Rhodoplanes elegans]|uniref:Trehalase n=1 Tax=Rhodoplanes elegans TaxID=29408 RepID=A0A327KUH2_9BRAD|nr:glycoside hydrolase family 15 protein [Rhodoplanes elegans]MBK5958795.1 glucoamylase [Rhodoplanes elegans]RAI38978.1 glucoamylase [Rhodoplanes elegans]